MDGAASPVHLLRGHKKSNEINEDGEGTSASPTHLETEISLRNFYFGNNQDLAGVGGSTSESTSRHDINDKMRNSRPLGQRETLDIEISSQEFSFRNKQDSRGVSGSN